MLFLLKKQLNQIENNLFFRLFMRLSFITVKYVVNLLIFLIATKKFTNQNEESWKRTVEFLTNILQNSTIRVRLSSSDLAALETLNLSKDDYKLFEEQQRSVGEKIPKSVAYFNNTEKQNDPGFLFNPKLLGNKRLKGVLELTQLKNLPLFISLKQSSKCKATCIKRLRSCSNRSRFFLTKDQLNNSATKAFANESTSAINANAILPDLVNEKAVSQANISVKEAGVGKNIDQIKFSDVQVPESLVKQLEYFDREELLQLIAYQKQYLDYKESRIRDLENYIDNLVVKIIEVEPSILMNASNVLSKNIRI